MAIFNDCLKQDDLVKYTTRLFQKDKYVPDKEIILNSFPASLYLCHKSFPLPSNDYVFSYS